MHKTFEKVTFLNLMFLSLLLLGDNGNIERVSEKTLSDIEINSLSKEIVEKPCISLNQDSITLEINNEKIKVPVELVKSKYSYSNYVKYGDSLKLRNDSLFHFLLRSTNSTYEFHYSLFSEAGSGEAHSFNLFTVGNKNYLLFIRYAWGCIVEVNNSNDQIIGFYRHLKSRTMSNRKMGMKGLIYPFSWQERLGISEEPVTFNLGELLNNKFYPLRILRHEHKLRFKSLDIDENGLMTINVSIESDKSALYIIQGQGDQWKLIETKKN